MTTEQPQRPQSVYSNVTAYEKIRQDQIKILAALIDRRIKFVQVLKITKKNN